MQEHDASGAFLSPLETGRGKVTADETTLEEVMAAAGVLFPGHRTFTTEVGGRPLTVDTGKVAKQAGGAAWVRYGDTVVLVTAVASPEPREGIDFFPLLVDYEERQYAAGRIPGNWFRREGRPTERAILSARLTDRPLRPLFPEGFRNDVHVVVTVLSVDFDNAPEICGILGASLALSLSDIPFNGPVAAVIVGRVNGQLVLNPVSSQSAESDLHLVVAGTRDAVMMVEAGAREVPEEVMLDAIVFAHEEIKRLVAFQEDIAREVGREKRDIPLFEPDADIQRQVRDYATGAIRQAITVPDKLERERLTKEAEIGAVQHFASLLGEDFVAREKEVKHVLRQILKEEVRRLILRQGERPDGRRPDEIRPVHCEVGLLPRTHGSALFTRGQTQVLTVATLGSVGDVKMLDSLEDEDFKRYMHHYNFPGFSVGEARPIRGPGRRDIGHGALAERALLPVIPDESVFPYTIRLVSEVLESNGSTSMASVCGSTLALMDTGVPIKAPVAGIAMGLIKEGEEVAILSDIQGIEDALGDMDFKVAGTERGVTALQMDIKIHGVDRSILERALRQAREGRLAILRKMLAVMPAPRPELSPYAPRIIVIDIDPDKIRDVIGPGGKTINKIIAETNVQIDIEDDGRVYIAATDPEAGQRALDIIRDLTRDVVPGATYLGRVVRITPFGAFVEVLPGKEGLVHISQLAETRVARVEDVVNIGDEVLVKVTEIDNYGRVNLSRKEALRDVARTGKAAGEEKRATPANDQPAERKLDLRRPSLMKRDRRRRGKR